MKAKNKLTKLAQRALKRRGQHRKLGGRGLQVTEDPESYGKLIRGIATMIPKLLDRAAVRVRCERTHQTKPKLCSITASC